MSSNVFIPSAADFYPPPYSFEMATSITFFVEPTDKQKLHDICDDCLNDPLGKPGRFVLNLERVLLTFSRFPEVEASDATLGYLSYQEVSFIILVYDTQEGEVGMFAPILFLDGPQAGNAEYFASWPRRTWTRGVRFTEDPRGDRLRYHPLHRRAQVPLSERFEHTG